MIEDQLHGLIIPNKETAINSELWIGIALLACLLSCLLGLAFYRWLKLRNSPLNIAKRKLQDLTFSHNNPSEETQTTALALVNILCEGHNVKRLDQIQHSHTADTKGWDDFQDALNTACYAKDSNADITSLLTQAKHWLSTP